MHCVKGVSVLLCNSKYVDTRFLHGSDAMLLVVGKTVHFSERAISFTFMAMIRSNDSFAFSVSNFYSTTII